MSSLKLLLSLGGAVKAAEDLQDPMLARRLRLELAEAIYKHNLELDFVVRELFHSCQWTFGGEKSTAVIIKQYRREMSGLLGYPVKVIRDRCG